MVLVLDRGTIRGFWMDCCLRSESSLVLSSNIAIDRGQESKAHLKNHWGKVKSSFKYFFASTFKPGVTVIYLSHSTCTFSSLFSSLYYLPRLCSPPSFAFYLAPAITFIRTKPVGSLSQASRVFVSSHQRSKSSLCASIG